MINPVLPSLNLEFVYSVWMENQDQKKQTQSNIEISHLGKNDDTITDDKSSFV